MQEVYFDVSHSATEALVSARVPAQGGDSALVAVFEKKESAEALAAVLNHAAKLYDRHKFPPCND